jgi:hypothetical protein
MDGTIKAMRLWAIPPDASYQSPEEKINSALKPKGPGHASTGMLLYVQVHESSAEIWESAAVQ